MTDDQLSLVTAFIGAPSTWGLLLRTIDIRPRQLTCITTSGQRIIAACGEIVNIYNAVTGVLHQSLSASETITKMQASPDGFTLFFAHSSSVTMWDAQTGGLIHTFITQPNVIDVALSASGDHIACGSSDGSVAFWNIRTKEGKGFGNGQPVVTICWLSPQKLAVATQNSLYIHDTAAGKTVDSLSIPDRVWGMIYSGEDEFLVGTSRPGLQAYQELCSLETISNRHPGPLERKRPTVSRGKLYRGKQSSMYLGELMRPTIMGKEIACITPPRGVQSFSTKSYDWADNTPPLDAAISVAMSLNRNLVVQTKDSIQIFSVDILTSHEIHNDVRTSRVYPLGKNHILCVLQPTRYIVVLELETLRELRCDDITLPLESLTLYDPQPNGDLTLLELETLREFRPDDFALPFESLLPNQIPSDHAPPCPELVVKFDLSEAMQVWRSGTSLPEWAEIDGKSRLLYELSPAGTKMVVVFESTVGGMIWIHDTKSRGTLASLDMRGNSLGNGEVYDITFGSETRFYLKIDRPRQRIQIPYDITPSPSNEFPHTITKGEPMPLSEPRATPFYSLDANCEWVLDAQSRQICWISPGNVRRGNGGHFWVGSSLVMHGDDGVVRKISFKEPDC